MPQLRVHMLQLKITRTATKTWGNQRNKYLFKTEDDELRNLASRVPVSSSCVVFI